MTLIAYALPALTLAVPTIPVYVKLPTFYAETVGLPVAAIGAALFLARVLDVVTDPLIGWASDRLRAPLPRRKPLVLLGAPIAGLGLYRLFVPEAEAGLVYLAFWAGVLYLGWTLVSLPYTAWAAELTPDYDERSRITGWREGLGLAGIMLAAVLPVLWPGDAASDLRALALAVILGGAATLLFLLHRVPDQPLAPGPAGPARLAPPAWRRHVDAFRRNKPFQRLILAWGLNGLANGLPAVLFPLFVTERLALAPADRDLLILAYFAAAIGAIPFWYLASRRMEKHVTWSLAMVVAAVTFAAAPFLPEGAFAPFLAICLVTGAALGADLFLPPSMQADVVDYDTWQTGEKRAGLFFALWSMVTKISMAAAVGIAFPLLGWAGFEAGGGNSTDQLGLLAFLYAGLPVLFKLGAVALVRAHPLTARRHRAIRRRLARRG
ncbi:MAG: MFS transporter, partial [Alphaproteobacteria bacterium]